MTEAELKRKLAAIEAMVHGAMTAGERAAAQHVFDTFKQKTPDEVSQELAFTVHDVWARKLFMAMLRKAGLEPYRMRGQRRTTIMIQGRKSLVELIWKEFLGANQTLTEYLAEVTDRVIRESLGEMKEDEARERPVLPTGTTPSS
jgi:hypothetical protein